VQKKTLILAMLPLLWACEDATGPEDTGQVTVRFAAMTAAGMSAQLPATFASMAPTAQAVPIDLGNGTVIDDIRLILSEVELEGPDNACLTGEDHGCEEIEVGPFLVSLLADDAGTEVEAEIPAGTYDELEFEVEDLEWDDDDDGSKQAVMADLLTQMQSAYEGFPSDASMVVHGTCATGGEFTVYFAAEIEVEKEFATPFVVPGDQSILVHLDPSMWFMSGGQPMDLCGMNGQTVDLEAEFEFENGVHVEDDD
jgi:hypothetical protein